MASASSFKVNAPKNLLCGTLPKIGIRPCIDGRRNGVREGLEEQTMRLAKAAAELLTRELRHACGLPVECVIADSTIGGFKEAADCAEKFARENVGVSITVTPCWCYGSETMDMDPYTPKAVWGFNGTERPGAVYLAAVLAAHAQKGLPAFGIYGRDVKDAGDEGVIPADVAEKLLRFSRAALAMATMRGKAYLSMGGTSMGIAGSMVNPALFEKFLGMRVESVDMSEFTRRIDEKIYDPEEYEYALNWVKENIRFGWDKNPPDKRHDDARKQKVLEDCVKMVIIGRDLMIGNEKLANLGFAEEACGHNAIASGFQGQRQWTDHFANGDFMESILCSSFDWNGIREPLVVATENDALNGICMLFGKLLTGTASGFADVRTYWSPEAIKRVSGWEPEGMAAHGLIHLINSGAVTLDASGECASDGKPAMKHWLDITPDEAAACVNATQYCYADLGYFRGGGYSSHLVSKGGMPLTMTRLNMIDGLGPVLQIAEGYSVDLPESVHNIIDARTDPTWPTTYFVPRLTGEGAFTDVYSVMNNWGANHGAFNYGHVGADFIALAAMLRIPVCMHNVDEKEVFRPSVWNAFGTLDRESADYRACANFGPVYGK